MTGLPHSEYRAYDREIGTYVESGGFVVEGHDRRSWAALSWMRRDQLGSSCCRIDTSAVTKRWAIFHETCGCTKEQHAKHGAPVPDDVDENDLDNGYGDCIEHCDDARNGLPPCNDDYAWTVEEMPSDYPGAVPILEWYW